MKRPHSGHERADGPLSRPTTKRTSNTRRNMQMRISRRRAFLHTIFTHSSSSGFKLGRAEYLADPPPHHPPSSRPPTAAKGNRAATAGQGQGPAPPAAVLAVALHQEANRQGSLARLRRKRLPGRAAAGGPSRPCSPGPARRLAAGRGSAGPTRRLAASLLATRTARRGGALEPTEV